MIWQDGEIYHAPSTDLLPEPLLLDDLNFRGEMTIYLTLPVVQPNKKNMSHDQEQQHSGRYASHLAHTHDLFTDAQPADITLLRRRAVLRLLDPVADPISQLEGFYTSRLDASNVIALALSNWIRSLLHRYSISKLQRP